MPWPVVAITLHAAKPSHVDVGVNQPYTKTVVADRDMLHKPQTQPSPPLVAEVSLPPLMPALPRTDAKSFRAQRTTKPCSVHRTVI